MIGQGSTVNPYNPPDPLTVDPETNLATSVVTWDQADLRPGRGPRGLCELITALKQGAMGPRPTSGSTSRSSAPR
jgi:hypothetical protein